MSAEPLPSLPFETLDWVNAREPVRLAALRGRVVILLFWAADDCHSCNVLPRLHRLLAKFHDGVVVLAMHTPRYTAQRQSLVVTKAAHRLHLRVPVANDGDWRAWRAYGVDAWPTAVVIDCDGHIAYRFKGEGLAEEVEAVVGNLLEDAAAREVRRFDAPPGVSGGEPQMSLRFPGGIAVGEQRVYVCDSSRNRILECTHEGRVLRQFGSGTPGYWDGHLAEAGFCDPCGLALSGESLYVADSGNHAVRRVRLASGQVETVLGCGRLGYDAPRDGGAPKELAISAPRSVLVRENQLYVSLGGQQQVWRLDLGANRVEVLAGSGRNAFVDGPAREAGLVQPCGLAFSAGLLVVADAAGNAIRALRMADGYLVTMAGAGPWRSGLADGTGTAARFAHPEGVAADASGHVYVADTYNGRICRVSSGGRGTWSAQTLAMPQQLQEPASLALSGRTLWIAERSAHQVLRFDLDRGALGKFVVGG